MRRNTSQSHLHANIFISKTMSSLGLPELPVRTDSVSPSERPRNQIPSPGHRGGFGLSTERAEGSRTRILPWVEPIPAGLCRARSWTWGSLGVPSGSGDSSNLTLLWGGGDIKDHVFHPCPGRDTSPCARELQPFLGHCPRDPGGIQAVPGLPTLIPTFNLNLPLPALNHSPFPLPQHFGKKPLSIFPGFVHSFLNHHIFNPALPSELLLGKQSRSRHVPAGAPHPSHSFFISTGRQKLAGAGHFRAAVRKTKHCQHQL